MANCASTAEATQDWDDDASLSIGSIMEEKTREDDRRQQSRNRDGASNTASNVPASQQFAPTGVVAFNEQNQPASSVPVMHTIDAVRRNSGDGYSSYDVLHIPPVHPFLSFYEDSDGSDGSIIFSYQPGTPTHDPRSMAAHDRFPSFDSTTSTGSVRYVAHNTGAPQHLQNTNSARVNAQYLPYHERRKLLLQQQMQQQPQRQQAPRQAGRPLPFLPPDMQNFYPAIPPHGYQPEGPTAPFQALGFPLPQQNYPIQTGVGFHSPPQQQQFAQLPPSGNYRARPLARMESVKPSSAAEKVTARGKPSGQPAPALYTLHSLPPSGSQRVTFSRSRTSSHDSTSPEREQYTASSSSQHKILRQKSSPSEFPPPPPPTAPPHQHVRTESIGSVSSLDSSNSPANGEKDEDAAARDKGHRHRHSSLDESNGSSNFLQMFNPWSPKPRTEPSAKEFHHVNQDFLRRSELERNAMKMVIAPLPQQPQRRGANDRPPPSRGTHKRLPSIENDNWDEEANVRSEQTSSGGHTYYTPDGKAHTSSNQPARAHSPRGEASSSSPFSSDVTDDDAEYFREPADERTSLLPPSGISTHERGDQKQSYTENRKVGNNDGRGERESHDVRSNRLSSVRSKDNTVRADNRKVEELFGSGKDKKHRKKNRSRSRRARFKERLDSDEDDSSTSSQEFRRWTKKRARLREKERARLIEQWKAEAKAETEAARKQHDADRWHRRCSRLVCEEISALTDTFFKFVSTIEIFLSNLPLTIGAIAMAIALLGVVWFKFVEENLDSCEPVHFHSSQCTFPEFPGCFYCDKSSKMYIAALRFHYTCSAIAGVLALSFIAKVLLATRVVLDEMSSPTTSSPAGLLCMTTVCVFAGRGFIGQVLVSAATCVHLCIVIWFIYMALAYHIMPEPSWFPNTVGIGLSAVKTWLYYPMTGQVLMAMSLSFMFFFFPISLIRVTLNEKISAPVGWMQMSAPAIALYALTIMAQPSFKEEHPDITSFQRVHRMVYLPCMHFLFALSVIGLLSSVQSLCVRWKDFRKKPFSPAHAAFCFPTLSHANAIQAYRAAVNSFSDIPTGSPLKVALYIYWVTVLTGGTLATCWITVKFLYCLPSWTHIDVADEEEPPAPFETSMTLNNVITTGETLRQPFVSPAVLQANETGALVMITPGDDRRTKFVRTRRLPALGFEPTMEWSEMEREREVLLEWVVKNPPRRRHRTLSVPGIDLSYGNEIGSGNVGIYGMEDGREGNRWRSNSSASPYITTKSFLY